MVKDRKAFEGFIRGRGCRLTGERLKLIDGIKRQRGHFNVDVLVSSLRKKGLKVSRDTVYRNLPVLLEAGMLQKSAGDSKREYFENMKAKGHHDHMVCVRCGAIVEFRSEAFEALQQKLCEKFRCKLIYHDHRLFVECRQCSGGRKRTSKRGA